MKQQQNEYEKKNSWKRMPSNAVSVRAQEYTPGVSRDVG